MKSLQTYISESLLDDEDEIMAKVESTVECKLLIDSILNSDNFDEYESQISLLREKMDKEVGAKWKPGQKTRFVKGLYLVIGDALRPNNKQVVYKYSKVKDIRHPYVLIMYCSGMSTDGYIISARDNDLSKQSITLEYSWGTTKGVVGQRSIHRESWNTENDMYVYKLSNTKFQDLFQQLDKTYNKKTIIHNI
jgi:hypothetical protein